MNRGPQEYIIGPSVLGVPPEELGAVIARLAPCATFFHLDVTRQPWGESDQGTPKLAARLRHTKLPVDVHWMGPEPTTEDLNAFAVAGATFFTIQFEAFSRISRLQRCLTRIRRTGMGVGISVAPHTNEARDTPATALRQLISEIDLLNVLTVVPGQSGQSYLERRTIEVAAAARMIMDSGRDIILQIDGGINSQSVKPVRPVTHGVRRVYFVSGSYLVRSADPDLAVRLLQRDEG